MAHSLRKYLSNRGSALFMVISTMTALMIACMAMYFSVISARTTQFATFFREQSYQSAVSLNDMVLADLMDGTLTSGDKDLLSTLAEMNEGETITTGANGFSSFDSTLTGSDIAQMGAYSMDITRLPNEMVNGKDNMTFDIATTTINNGVADTVHTYVHVQMSDEEIPNGDNIFAATGYVPNDAFLDAGKFMTDAFFDTEFTYLSLYGNASTFGGDLKTGGSLYVNKAFMPMTDGTNLGGSENVSGRFIPVTWGIRGNMSMNFNGALKFRSGSKIFIGGDYTYMPDSGAAFSVIDSSGSEDMSGTIDVYVLGDLKIKKQVSFKGVNLYVHGNISAGSLTDVKNLYVSGNDLSTHTGTTPAKESWDSSVPGLSYEDAKRELNRTTYSKTYKKWVINGEDALKKDYVPEINASTGTKITLQINNQNIINDGVDAMKTAYVIAYPGSKSDTDGTADVVSKGGIIEGFKGKVADSATGVAIIIDTGDDPDNVMTFRVKAYLDKDGRNFGDEVFRWFPDYSSCPKNVIVKGKGIVIIDIPDGVTYQDAPFQQTMHYSWWKVLGGKEDKSTIMVNTGVAWEDREVTSYNNADIINHSAALATSFIHYNCTNADACSYSTYDAKDDKGQPIKCEKHKKVKIGVTCSVTGHETTSVSEFCEECDKFQAEKVKKLVDGTFDEGVCSNRLDQGKVQAYVNTHPDRDPDISYNGMPNVNIFLVCSAESAEIQLSHKTADYKRVESNGFYGFIYAPYMTFKAEGQSGPGCMRMLGGLVVSDYAIDDHYPFANCYPTKMPNDLMGESSEVMTGLTDKSWKIGLGSY